MFNLIKKAKEKKYITILMHAKTHTAKFNVHSDTNFSHIKSERSFSSKLFKSKIIF